jgi:hypothetical protein
MPFVRRSNFNGGAPPRHSDTAPVNRKNLYQMALEHQQLRESGGNVPPLMVKRNSWGPGLAEVVAFDPPVERWDAAKAPDFGHPKAFMLVKYRDSEPYALEEITSGNTLAYERVERPSWWRKGLKFPVTAPYGGKRMELHEDGSFAVVSKATAG